ncbi:hypothetical protein I317_01358 [Kwoniella heveanensis CBS 569]|uniref:Glucose receptor Git3-like N-terminal domain-containing protein n=1 Tax=Kwoniella heveanensis BCC8398 TaxID=1296120 RepID=A0A1B9GS68_9TREE|nr:hypothetical protein I316_04578 [Kwoniella heveanensis BCC8398]OCF44869.1 hypothetical protein I317_01358 [Kwoniella heveanensis CBS 569]
MFVLEFFKGRPGTTRIRIVQALIFSDLLLGIIGLISSILWLSGDGSAMNHGTTSCSGLGFMLTAILWTEHGWTLVLAIATYMILIYPLHWFTLWLEKRWYYLWAIVWTISLTVAIIGQTVWGFYPAGGLCFYGDNTGLYSELMQFIPRAIVCIVISVLYARLYVFLRRPDKIRIPGSNSMTGGAYETVSSTSEKGLGGDYRPRIGSLIPGQFWKKRGNSSDSSNVEGQVTPINNNNIDDLNEKDQDASRRGSKTNQQPSGPATSKDIPPWERLELPPFQIAGERFGDRSTPATPSIWSGWKGMGRKRSSTASGMTGANPHGGQQQQQQQQPPPQQPGSRINSVSSSSMSENRYTPPGLSAPRMPSIPSEDVPETRERESISVSATGTVPELGEEISSTAASNPNSDLSHQRTSTNETLVQQSPAPEKIRKRSLRMSIDPQLPLSPKSFHLSSPEVSPRIEKHRPSVTISEDSQYFNPPASPKLDQAESAPANPNPTRHLLDGSRAPPPPPIPVPHALITTTPATPTTPVNPTHPLSSSRATPDIGYPESPKSRLEGRDRFGSNARSIGAETGDEGDEEDVWDLARMLAQPPPGASTDDRFAPPPGETYELVPESMSSYLNRKTALLMLWFPLGYLFLFSVSLIRLIYDFAGDPPVALRAISKWMVLGQGVLDALIYGVVEWHTKRVVRKKVRKGTFSNRGNTTPSGSRIGASAAGFFKNMGSKMSGGGGLTSRGDGGGASGSGGGQGDTSSRPRFDPTSSLMAAGGNTGGDVGVRSNPSRRGLGEVSFAEQVEEWNHHGFSTTRSVNDNDKDNDNDTGDVRAGNDGTKREDMAKDGTIVTPRASTERRESPLGQSMDRL